MGSDEFQRLEKGRLSQAHRMGRHLLLLLAQVTQWGDFTYLWSSPIFSKPFKAKLLFSLQLCDIYTFLGYSSQMRLHCIASDLCQKELQMFQRKCAETMWLKQNKLCLKSRKCPNKWEMHQFLWEHFSLPLPPVFISGFFYFTVWYSRWFFHMKKSAVRPRLERIFWISEIFYLQSTLLKFADVFLCLYKQKTWFWGSW